MSDAETLADLIRTHQHDRTQDELAADSQGPDSSCSRASWTNFLGERRPMDRSPERSTIAGIAKALGVSPARVWAAIGVTMGIITETADSQLITLLRTQPTSLLTGRQVGILVQIVDAFTDIALTSRDVKGSKVRALTGAPSARAARKQTGNEDR